MGRRVLENAEQHIRHIDGRFWGGEAFFNTKKRAKGVAKKVRDKFAVPCRAIVIPASESPMGHGERYLIMLPIDSSDPVLDEAGDWIREQKGVVR